MSLPVSFPSQAPVSSLQPTSILDVALNEYRKNTGQDLRSHPLAIELQSCNSVDGILALLQRQAGTLQQLKDGNRRLMKWVCSSVNILYSITATLGDGAGLVRLGKRKRGYRRALLTSLSGVPTCKTNLYRDWYSPCRTYLAFPFFARFDSEILQVAKDVTASHVVLLKLFERMEDFFKRFKVYSQSFVNAELAEVLVKVVVKVLNILSIATKEVEQSRASESRF
jgi:hypothetical protein